MALSLGSGLLIKGIEVIEDKILGKGSYGVVYEARYYGAPVAAKRLHSIFFEAGTAEEGMFGMLENFSQEWSLLRRLKHPNIVEFFGVYCPSLDDSSRDDLDRSLEVDEKCFIVCELLVMSLQERICEKPSLNFRHCVDISLQIASGLRYLHERADPIMHRDLAAKNVLLSHSGEAKIADLGVAKAVGLSKKVDTYTRHPGTDSYMPVEVRLANADYNESIDVFALGIIILELCICRDSVASEPFKMTEGTVKVIPELQRREFDFETLHQRSEYRPLEKIICHCLEEKKLRPTAQKVSAELLALKGSQDYRSTPEVPVIESGLQSLRGSSVATMQQESETLKMMLRDRDRRVQELTEKISREQSLKDKAYRELDETHQKLETLQASNDFKQTKIAELEAEVRVLSQGTAEKTTDREPDMRRSHQRLTRLGSMPTQGDQLQPTRDERSSYPQQLIPTLSSQSGSLFRHSGVHTVGGRRTEMVVPGSSLPFMSASSREWSVPISTANYASLHYPPAPQTTHGDDYSTTAPSRSHMLSANRGEWYSSSSQPPHHPPQSMFDENTLGQEIKQPPPATGRRPEAYATISQFPGGGNVLHSRGKAFQLPSGGSAQLFSADEKGGVISRSIHLPEARPTSPDHDTILEEDLTAFKKKISNLVAASMQSDGALLEQARAIRLQGEQLQKYLQSSGYYQQASRPRDRLDDEVVPHQLQLQKECDKMLRTVQYIMGCAVTGDDCLLHAAQSLVDSGAALLTSITPDLH